MDALDIIRRNESTARRRAGELGVIRRNGE